MSETSTAIYIGIAAVITAAATGIAAVLVKMRRSRCSKIRCCWGLFNCEREVVSDDDVVDTPSAEK